MNNIQNTLNRFLNHTDERMQTVGQTAALWIEFGKVDPEGQTKRLLFDDLRNSAIGVFNSFNKVADSLPDGMKGEAKSQARLADEKLKQLDQLGEDGFLDHKDFKYYKELYRTRVGNLTDR